MGFGHLDYETGKWIDDPADADDAHDLPIPVATTESPPIPNGPESATGGSNVPHVPAPLSLADKARLVRTIHSGQGSPAEIESARQLLARSR